MDRKINQLTSKVEMVQEGVTHPASRQRNNLRRIESFSP